MVAKNVSLKCSSCFLPEVQWSWFVKDYSKIEFCSNPGHNKLSNYILYKYLFSPFFKTISTHQNSCFSASKICTESLIIAYIMKAKIQVCCCYALTCKT